MSNLKYWADHFDANQKANPDDSVKALNFSNPKLMNQVHEEVLSCIDFSKIQYRNRVLDTGCGTGELLGKLISKCGGSRQCEYFATDISSQMLEKAKKNTHQVLGADHKNCHFSIMSVDDMKFENGYFSLILASESLQYTDPYSAILELIRMTEKNGQVVISIPNHNSPFIQKAREKHKGLFTGLDFEKAFDVIAPKVSSFLAKPLIFAEKQDEKPYLEKNLEKNLDNAVIQQANRFVVYLIV